MRDLRAGARMPLPGEPFSLDGVLRLLLAVLGLALVLVGAMGCLHLFFTAHALVKDPVAHQEILNSWRTVLGLAGAHVEVAGQQIAFEGPITVAVLFAGFLLLVVLLGRILKAGLTLLSWVREDRRKVPPPSAAPPELPATAGDR